MRCGRAVILGLALGLGACAGDGDDGGDRCGGTSCAPGSLVWSGEASSPFGVRITSVASSPGEPPWFAGTFQRQVHLGGRSAPDGIAADAFAFAARIGAREHDGPWIGHVAPDVAPRAASVLPDREEGAVLVTDADVPGAGWRVDAYRVDRLEQVGQRAVIAELTLPPDNGVASVTGVDPAGWPLVAVSGLDIQIEPRAVARRAVLLRLGQGLVAEKLFDLAGIEINDLAPATATTVAIGGRYQGTPPGWPTCPETSCGFAATVDVHGGSTEPLVSLFVFRASGGASVLAVGGDPAGNLAVLCSVAGTTLEPTFLDPQPTLYLAFTDGPSVYARTLSSSADLALSGHALEATDDGAVVALSFQGTILVDGAADQVSNDGSGTHDVVIGEYPRQDGAAGWHLLVRSDVDADVTALAVEGSQVSVGGNYTGQLSIASGTVLDRTVDDGVSNGFVLELIR